MEKWRSLRPRQDLHLEHAIKCRRNYDAPDADAVREGDEGKTSIEGAT
jgi:hypothetical protein